jgi:signal transduction histidine kinase
MSVECTDGVARLVLWNDGAGKRARDTHEPRSGSGILNLTHRLEALGGTLTVNCEGKDGFALEAVVRL